MIYGINCHITDFLPSGVSLLLTFANSHGLQSTIPPMLCTEV
jgi:hypothetical protein